MTTSPAAPAAPAAPAVTVVIPAYNVAPYIAGAIRSVLDQTFGDFEVVVVDDGSTDDSAAIARAAGDPRVRVVTQANRGLAGARNGGIRAARGRHLAFLDADDLWHPLKLERHVRHLDANPDVGVSYSQSLFIDDAGRPMRYLQRPKLREVTARDVFLRNPIGNGSAPVIRRATLDDIAFARPDGRIDEPWYFDERLRRSEDIECWLRIALLGTWRLEGIGEPLTLYRVNAGGLSANLDAQLQSWEQVVAKLAPTAPVFFGRHVRAARGYQLRYLARRAIRSGRAGQGLALAWRALRGHPGMLLEEPARTAATFAAALAAAGLPAGAYRALESLGMRLTQAGAAAPPAAPRHPAAGTPGAGPRIAT